MPTVHVIVPYFGIPLECCRLHCESARLYKVHALVRIGSRGDRKRLVGTAGFNSVALSDSSFALREGEGRGCSILDYGCSYRFNFSIMHGMGFGTMI